MKRIIIALAVFLLFFSCSGERIAPDYFTFTVQDSSSNRLASIEVAVYLDGWKYNTTRTDAEGLAYLAVRETNSSTNEFTAIFTDNDGEFNYGSFSELTTNLSIDVLSYTVTLATNNTNS